jgi:hypothetical protein
MTLVLNAGGHLLQYQLGINEFASSLVVARTIGSIFSRKADSSIFKAFSDQYGVRFNKMPPWLEDVTLQRPGTILGEHQRRIPVDNTLADVEFNTVEGAATFMILIIRYVVPTRERALYIQELLCGDFGILNGGLLEQDHGPDISQPDIPYPTRTILRKFIDAVIDSDADSPQHHKALQWMSDLTQLVGGSDFLDRTTRHSSGQYKKLLRQLLGQKTFVVGRPKLVHHTLSAGAAMITLAAIANGAHAQVICKTSTGTFVLPKKARPLTQESAFTVYLWLTEPPDTMAGDLTLAGREYYVRKTDIPFGLTVYGGSIEVVRALSKLLCCPLRDHTMLEIWTNGILEGESATWEIKVASQQLLFTLSDASLDCKVPADLGMALANITVEGSEKLELLHRKEASLLHSVLGYTSYQRMDQKDLSNLLKFARISYCVGCFKSLVSEGKEHLSLYSWTTSPLAYEDNETFAWPESEYGVRSTLLNLYRFMGNMTFSGASCHELLWQAALIWGGTPPTNHSEYGTNLTNDRVMGVVAPRLTFLCTALRNPKDAALYGISQGILSVHIGSTPMLPKDPISNLIRVGSLTNTHQKRSVDLYGLRRQDEEAEGGIILTLEPFEEQNAPTSIILCAWQHGEVILELDLYRVFFNLLAHRNLATEDNGASIPRGKKTQRAQFCPLYLGELPLLEDIMLQGYVVPVVRAGDRPEWQVIAAGTVHEGDVYQVRTPTDGLVLSKLCSRADVTKHPLANKHWMVIVCKDSVLPRGFSDLLQPYKELVQKQKDSVRHFISYVEPDTQDCVEGWQIFKAIKSGGGKETVEVV